MDKLVRQITLVRLGGENTQASVIYKGQRKRRRKVSALGRPLERVARRLSDAQLAFGEEAVRLHNKSTRKRRDGWLWDAPINVIKSQRKAYNQARKAAPFGVLPKA
jgi:hypothetical protein